MKSEDQVLDVGERRRQKAASRQLDERALASGEKSAAQLRHENGHFSGLKVRVDLKGAKTLY